MQGSGPFVLAWLTGEAIIAVRSVRVQGGPVWPGQLLAGTGAFAVLAIIAEFGGGARTLALTVAWGVDLAAFLNLAGMAPPNPAGSGWWANVTGSGNAIPADQILPSGCGGTSAAAGSAGSSSPAPSSSAGSSGSGGLRYLGPGSVQAG